MLVEMIAERKKFFAAQRAAEQRSKPPTKTQIMNIMCPCLKNMGGYKHNHLKGRSYEEIQKLFDKAYKQVNLFIPMDSEVVKSSVTRTERSSKRVGDELESDKSKKQKIDEHVEAEKDDDQEETEMKKYSEIVKDDEVAINAIPVATKPPMIVEYKIVKEGKFGYFKLIRADRSSKRYSSMIKMLQNIDREDLETLWKLVKAKHENTRLEEDMKECYGGDMKVMFEPDINSKVWRNLQGHKVTIWKLFDTFKLLRDYYCWKDYADREEIKIDWRTRILMKISIKEDIYIQVGSTINLLWKAVSEKLDDAPFSDTAGGPTTQMNFMSTNHHTKEELQSKGIKSPSKLLSLNYLSQSSIIEQNKNPSSPKRVYFVNSIVILNKENEVEEEGSVEPSKTNYTYQKNANETDEEVESEKEVDEETEGETEEEDEDNPEHFGTFPTIKELRKPFVEATGLVYNKEEGTIVFKRDKERIIFKIPHKMDMFKHVDFKDRGTDSIPPFVIESDDDNCEKTHYSDSLDELYFMRRSLEVLRKLHWIILGGRFNHRRGLILYQAVGIKSLLEVTAAKLVLLVQKLLLLVLKVNAAGIKVTTAERLQLLKG
ncbi:hypothetical protein Tco_1106857 [Tanacetum coccineum]